MNSMSDELRSQDLHDILASYGSRNLNTLATRITAKSATSIGICINIDATETTPGILSRDISDPPTSDYLSFVFHLPLLSEG